LELERAKAERLLGGLRRMLRDRGQTHLPDGPRPPCWLYWEGQKHLIKRGRAFELLNFMWSSEYATVESVIAAVWPDPVMEGSVMTYVSRVNASLPIGFPKRISRSGSYLTWVHHQGR
jgi:hypothetical protein